MNDDDRTYRIRRFRFDKPTIETDMRGLTLDEAQEHCSDPFSRGDGWFDGFTEE